MSHAFNDLYSIPDAFRGLPMAGRTDTAILSDAAAAHTIPPVDPGRFLDVYAGHLARELDQPASPGSRRGIMPGVRALLDVLATRDDVYLALLTGNYERTAQLKLEYFDLWRYFPCGAFGDDAPERNRLLPRALARIRECGGPSVAPEHTIVIGDTPLDVACAAAAGARSLAVATGGHSVEELRASGADVVFADLSDTTAVIEGLAGLAGISPR
jgi:phosphoglycolate phosphatase-like HAD superfamily hydrolase